MSVLLHLSDTHFGTDQPAVTRALRALAQEQQVTDALLTGDITMRARRGQFAAARAFMDSLPVRQRMALPGNHDISLWLPWRRFLWPYRLYQEYFPTAFDQDGVIHWDLGNVQVIGVRTTRRYRHVHGEVSEAQIRNIGQRLHTLPGHSLKLVAVHQPVLVIEEEERKNLLRGAARACAAWRAAGADAILGGHIHEPYVEPVPPDGSGTSRPLWAIQAGTAVSSRIRDAYPNSVHLIRPATGNKRGTLYNPLQLHSPQWQAERWDFDAALQAFTCVATTWLRS